MTAMSYRDICLALLVAASLGACTAREPGSEQVFADLVLDNGTIYTVDDSQLWAEAIAIVDDQIAYVGSSDGVQQWVGPTTTVQDLQGQFLQPGFVDSHSHLLLGGAHFDDLELDPTATTEAWLSAIAAFAEKHPDQDVIMGYGFLASSFSLEGPTRQLIDAVVPDRPVFILDEGMHGAWLNSAALQRLGINSSTPDPAPGFDYYKRDEAGNPTGYLLEGTVWKAIEDLGAVSVESLVKGTAQLISLYNRYGITAAFDAGPWEAEENQLEVLEALDQSGRLSLRFAGSYYIDDPANLDTVIAKVQQLKHQTEAMNYPINTLKIMVDGTVEGRTAAMFEDYQGDPGNRGETVLTVAQLNSLVNEAVKADLDVHFHALGERAVSESLDAIELAMASSPASNSRFTLSHIQVMKHADIARFARHYVIAQSTPLWASYDEAGKEFVNEDQFNRYYLFNSLNKAGVTLSFGSDFPSTGAGKLGISPLYNIEIGHTRQDAGHPAAPVQPPQAERLGIPQLIKAYTINGAYQMRLQDQIGTLTVGKKADMVLLGDNPFTVMPHSLHTIPVQQTWVGGRTVYLRDER